MASFAEQFGIRLEVEDICWSEYSRLFAGISGDSALGRIVSIRSEKNPKMLKSYSKEQKRIRRDWINRQQQKDPETTKRYLNALDNMFKTMLTKGR